METWIHSQRKKDIKKFGQPKYSSGDKVKTTFTGNDVLTIKGNAWCNGFTWMYSFEENEKSLGQKYITKYIPY